MSIKLRFALLLGVLLLIFLGSLGMLRMLEKEQLTEALASSQRDATEMLERWLDLNGSGLRQFAEDYSRWDDMVTFVKTRDPEWAEVNIRQSMGGFNAHAVWVLTTDGTPIYQTETDDARTPVPVSPADWRQLVADNPYPHFFAAHGTDLLEIRAAPIQPSSDANRTTPPQGWLLAARLWNQAHLDALGHLTESTLRLSAPDRPVAPYVSESKLTIMRPLNDWRGHTLDMLYVTRETPAIAHRLRTDAFEARVFIVFGLLVMGALGSLDEGHILQDYGLNPNGHPKVMNDLNQSVGEAIIDTILQVLDDHADDPRIAEALREARGEPAGNS